MTTIDESAYALAKQQYADLGVDTDAALRRLATVSISLHCWQGDDVGGIRGAGRPAGWRHRRDRQLSGQGAHAGRAPPRRREGVVADSGHASLQPARVLRRVRRPARRPRRDRSGAFRRLDRLGEVARDRTGLQSDAASRIRRPPTISRSRIPTRPSASFWIRHAAACRRIGAAMGKALGTPCVTNVWIPDGMKDTPVDRVGPRQRLTESLDAVFAERLDPRVHPGLGRGQAVRPRLRELHRRLARVLSRLRDVAQASSTRSTPATTIRPKPSPTRSARS